MKENYYDILGIPFDASADEVRSAFREKALLFHPDVNKAADARELFMQIEKAYRTLSDEQARINYDQNLPPAYKIPPVAVTSLYSRSGLLYSDTPQVLYAMIKMSAQENDLLSENPPLNICISVDTSTSMQGPLLDTIKSTAIELVRQMRPQDIFSMVAFNDRAEVVIPAMPINNRSYVETSIRMLRASGGTEIYQGLEAAYNEIQRNHDPRSISHIIVITDGRTYGDEEDCLRLAKQAGQQEIGISGLGIGSKWNDPFLDRLASLSGGSTVFVSQPKDVGSFLHDKVNQLGKSYAKQIRYEFELADGVELRYAFRLQPEPTALETTSPINLGNLLRQESVEFILDLYIPPLNEIHKEFPILKGRLHFGMPNRMDSTHSVRLDLNRTVVPSTDGLSPPQSIIQAMSGLTLYRIQERAREAVKNGKAREATRLLQNVATHLFARGETNLARTVIGEAENIYEKNDYSEDGDKRIKYGTRALLLPAKMEKSL